MKTIFYILMIAVSHQINSQIILPVEQSKNYDIEESKNKYFKDTNGVFDKFIGTWTYINNPINPTTIFEVTFYKLEYKHNGTNNSYRDCLSANFKLIENGVVIYNIENPDIYQIYGGHFRDPLNVNKYHMTYSEPNENIKGFYYDFNIEYLPNNGSIPQLKWDLDILLELEEGAEYPLIPRHIILTKQL